MHPLAQHPLRSVFTASGARTRRASSWDRTGGNFDFITVGPGQAAVLLDVAGPGCITHLYGALAFPEITDYRDSTLRCYWDGEEGPSIETFFAGDFAAARARLEARP